MTKIPRAQVVHTFTAEKCLARIAKIEVLLRAKPMTALELGDALGVDRKTSRLYLVHLRARIHIAGWAQPRSGGIAAQLWGWGAQADAIWEPPPAKAHLQMPRTTQPVLPAGEVPKVPPRIRAMVERSRQVRRPPARRDWSVAMFFPL